jgi:FixJ family two-component response regulator
MTDVPTVFVVDDDVGVLKSIGLVLASARLPFQAFTSSEEFLAAWSPERPGCLVLDLRLGNRSGLDLQDEILRRRSSLPIIVMTGFGDVATSVRALKSGAFDFLQKPVPSKTLLERITSALSQDREVRASARERAGMLDRLARLTPREREVMDLLIAGKTSKGIARALDVSVRTVEGHRHLLFLKMRVSSATQLVTAVLSVRPELHGHGPNAGAPSINGVRDAHQEGASRDGGALIEALPAPRSSRQQKERAP